MFVFLKVKSVPSLFWSAPHPLTMRPSMISLIMLMFGLTLFGLGEALLIASGSGVSPWTVLAQGITNITNWSIGFSTFVVSVSVLITWFPLRQIPGIGTILNILIIALVIDLSLPYLPQFETLSLQIIEALAGVIITGIGGGIYLIAKLGAGPRDGLMTGLQRVTNLPIATVRSGIEMTVVILGWMLGGVAGIGTVLFAFGIGPSVAASMYVLQMSFNRKE
ncbi:MAG: YczE/YyaS/YitT family protein [Candidatus Puniceispirillales bacterium]